RTMLNYKCKSRRGGSLHNRTDSLCIVEYKERIVRAFACVIPNKEASTLIPIITRNVANNSIIWTDEQRSYSCLSNFNFTQDSVCHKYRFITDEGVNTQAVESFNNELKSAIKARKGLKTEK
ncbi:hypothetical protein H312_00692, partial [Anncaliia algerae PRA339]